MMDPVVNVSAVLIYCIGPYVSRVTLAGVGGLLPLIFGLIFIWMPETPYFLIMKAKLYEAEQSLIWLRGTSNVSDELKMIQESVESGRRNTGTVNELINIPGNRKALIIAVGLMAAQQLSGISAVVAYSSLIFGASGSKLDSSICVIVVGVVQILVGVLTAFVVDLAGRRLLLLVSTIGSIFFLVGVAVYFQLQVVGVDVGPIFWLPVTAMIGFIMIFTIGLGTLPHVVLSEIFPCNVKALATMVSNIAGSVSSVVVTKLYQVVADAYGIHTACWGFACVTVSSAIFIYSILPETKRRSLQEIQDGLHKSRKE